MDQETASVERPQQKDEANDRHDKLSDLRACVPSHSNLHDADKVSNGGNLLTKRGWGLGYKGPPDGGYGWVILLASFLLLFGTLGTAVTGGIFLVELLDVFEEGEAMTALISSVNIGLCFLLGPLATVLTNRFGFRFVVMGGSLLTTLGYLLSSFATNIYVLLVTYGIIVGLGYGIILTPGSVVIIGYFTNKLPLAAGLSFIGTPAGTLVMSQVVTGLIDYFGWRGAYMMLAGLSLNMCVIGALLRPVDVLTAAEERVEQTENTYTESQEKRRELFNVKVLKSPAQWLLVFCVAIWNLSGAVMYLLIAEYAEYQGIPAHLASWIITAMGFFGIVGGIIAGVLPNKPVFNRMLILATGTFGAALAIVCVPVSSSFLGLMTVGSLAGLFLVIKCSVLIPALEEFSGPDSVHSAYSLQVFGSGIGTILGPPIAGWLFEATGDFSLPFYFAGGITFIPAVLYFVVYLKSRKAV